MHIYSIICNHFPRQVLSNVATHFLLSCKWKDHKPICTEPCGERRQDAIARLGCDINSHYDRYLKVNDEALSFMVFRALYKKVRTHILFLEMNYYPEDKGNIFQILPSSLVVYSRDEMLHQSERNAAISKSVTDNLEQLHTDKYTVAVCIIEVGNIERTPDGENFARMAKFARETELTEASAHISVVSLLERINSGKFIC